ncbi:MAG: leucine-rich repeat protein [Lachnospiraceae bacterium]|nr:leucine-rich repeat protein [Lachnospiraceae bacterium]
MRKKVVLLGFTLLFMLMNINCMEVWAKEEFTSLNPVIDVGNEIYVQHDENNGNIYDLKKSETGITTVYKVILAEFTGGKAWTKDGEFIDNVSTAPHGATAPKDYIPVVAGEEYFIKTYGVGMTEGIWYTPVLFLDDNDNVISDELTAEFSKSKAGVIVKVPENATKMHLTMFNHQSFTLQKVLNLTDEEFDKLPIKRTQLENDIKQKYEQYQQDKTLYKKLDKAYITFVNDDTWGAIDEYAEVFMDKKVPLVLATIPELLIENASSQKETRLDVARRVEAAGGEIIAHNGGVLTQEGFSDYDTMYSFFVRTKQLFNYYEFDVNGIILAGGTGQVAGAQESEEWASSLYSYSDLYGVEYDKKEIALDSVYYHGRKGLAGFGNDLERIKKEIDSAITKQSWLIFYFHTSNEIDMEVMKQVLDYVNSKSETELEVVTYKEMYQKNAAKESEIINTDTACYYVSSTGTSLVGTDKNDPMSYETAKKKHYRSGDTILFKKGDTFYGSFNPSIVKVDDKITTISSYGEGEMPNISGYKIVNSEESWQLHEDGIYKIDLTDTKYFSGLTATDTNSTNIGFLEDSKGEKYFNKKGSLDKLENEYDFYCDEKYLYIKSDENPYDRLGELKLATQINLFVLHSDLKIENIRFSGTGAHGLAGSDENSKNIEISNNIIEDIGGSYLKETIRYGNGIEFYGTNVSNVVVKNNIIRNTYDVGFTIQGTQGSGKNVVVKDNVFVNNSHDSEIWESGSATGVESYEFTNNISINAGRGWGYEAREDKYAVAHILFWQYLLENTDIYFHDNIVYNPRRIYFVEQTNKTNIFFQKSEFIRSDYNTYLLGEDTKIFRDFYSIEEKDTFVSEYKKDVHSTFELIEVKEDIINTSANSNDVKEIRKALGVEEPDVEPTVTITPTPMVTVEPTVVLEATNIPTPSVTPVVTMSPEPTVTMTPTITPEPTVTMTPTVTPEPTVTPLPTIEDKPTATPDATNNVKPTLSPSPTTAFPAQGTKLTDTATKAVYVVTKAEDKDRTVTYANPINKSVKTVSIPKTVTIDNITYKVTAIAPNAFKNCKKLTKITMKTNIKIIGKSAFSGCVKLKSVNIGSNVTTIGTQAFYKCTALKKITIPSKVNKIGTKAFYKCTNLKSITIKTTKLTTKNVGSKAFKGIHSEATIKVPKSKLKAYKKMLKKKGISSQVNVEK